MKEQILQLKNQGLTIQQIANTLNCSRPNVAYHTDAIAKEKTFQRIRRQRANKKASRPLKVAKNNEEMKEEILKLHAEGLSYRQIQEKLKCSKGTISFHLGSGQKEKSLARGKVYKQKIRGEKIKEKSESEIKLVLKQSKKVKQEKIKPIKKTKKDFKLETKQTKVFKTKDQKLGEKIPVELGDKKRTIVFTFPGYDIEKLRAKYLK